MRTRRSHFPLLLALSLFGINGFGLECAAVPQEQSKDFAAELEMSPKEAMDFILVLFEAGDQFNHAIFGYVIPAADQQDLLTLSAQLHAKNLHKIRWMTKGIQTLQPYVSSRSKLISRLASDISLKATETIKKVQQNDEAYKKALDVPTEKSNLSDVAFLNEDRKEYEKQLQLLFIEIGAYPIALLRTLRSVEDGGSSPAAPFEWRISDSERTALIDFLRGKYGKELPGYKAKPPNAPEGNDFRLYLAEYYISQLSATSWEEANRAHQQSSNRKWN